MNTEDEMSEDDDDFGGGAKKEEDDDPAARKYSAQWKNSHFQNFCWMIRTQPISLFLNYFYFNHSRTVQKDSNDPLSEIFL